MSPVTVLNVAEKPSVARSLSSVFARMPGAKDRPMRRDVHQVFLQDNVCFPSVYSQGQGRHVQGPATPHTMITTSVRGHLASQDFGPRYGWNKCPHLELFSAPVETFYSEDMQPLEQMLKQQARRAQALILWLDCDREGEAIGFEVQTVCLQANPRLQVYRARFSTVLPQEIQRALHSLGTLNQNFVQAVQARMILDLRVGAAFTRFQTMRLQRKFDIQGVISYGPCQFPTLGFVVERWARIETFVPEDFWFLQLDIQLPIPQEELNAAGGGAAPTNAVQNRPIHFTWKRARLYDRVVTMALYEACLEAQTAVVCDMQGRPKHKWRPVPLATVELQKRASKFLRYGAEQVMTAAENLYQNGYISYPRTETEKFRPEFQHQTLIRDFTQLGQHEFATYADKLLNQNGFQRPRAGQHDDQAHPPITPCKAIDPNIIDNEMERNVYILVVKHYLACCSRDAVGNETSITVKMGPEDFTAKGLMITEQNWLEIYSPWERWSTGQGQLPPLQVGSRITPSSFLMQQGRTNPPRLLSEAELISLMDRNGIGTDATIASHIQTIQERGYAVKNAQQEFSPTQLGIALVEGYNSMGYQLNKPDLRREVEHECNLVASGQKTMEDIMGPILTKMKETFQRAMAEAHKLDAAVARHLSPLGSNQSVVLQASFTECGVCHNFMALKETRPQHQQYSNHNASPQRRKVLYCNTCSTGFSMPKGDLQPGTIQDHGQLSPQKCPICNFQIVRVTKESGGSSYTVCPKCYTDPPPDHGGDVGGETFPCFKCHHPNCTMATGAEEDDIQVFSCPFCTGTDSMVSLGKTQTGASFLSCINYQRCGYTIWMPKEARTINVPEGLGGICPTCSRDGRQVRMLHFVWKNGSVPMHLGRESTVCVLCDVAFREGLRVRVPQPGQVTTTQRRTYHQTRVAPANNNHTSCRGGPSSRATHGGRGRGGGNRVFREGRGGRGGTGHGGVVCFRCNQPGHFANNCPQTQ